MKEYDIICVMLEILSKIPFFVWPLFILAIFGGLKARNTHWTPLLVLWIFPTLFFVWSLSSYFDKYGADWLTVCFWGFCFLIGVLTGMALIFKQPLRFHKQKKLVELQGSWLPLTLSMSVFASKFSIGILGGYFPELKGSALFFSLELLAVAVLGVFAGRAVICIVRYVQAKGVEESS